ncbi:RmlC-like cupin domain-containing protein [Elsinoe ampelina]|uniref:RmlC-like cupin domain-containing protein n=1 Tax=Elsinoe ampelina TaxID=302913 RepID=A0A6A6GFY7_9PEZI|nr:RmlC-like cupin domain-containing protein [Elsinoe ampelina]
MPGPIKPHYPPPADLQNTLPLEPPHLASLIHTLNLRPHIEGGYFVETDRSPLRIPNAFLSTTNPAPSSPHDPSKVQGTHALQRHLEASTSGKNTVTQPGLRGSYNLSPTTRSASTSILYLLTPANPQGNFHRNKSRAIHSLVSGRGRYVVIHPVDEGSGSPQPPSPSPSPGLDGRTAAGGDRSGGSQAGEVRVGRVETFVVGKDVAKGERVQWVVEGGRWKGSFLLGAEGEGGSEREGDGEQGLLISETVVPGFEYEDHEFLTREKAREVLGEREGELGWLVRKG